MSVHLIPIKMAFISFPIIAFLITIPFAIFQYRKYGYINKLRTVILYSFLLYLMTAYYLVIMPLPKSRDVRSTQAANIEYYNLKPFNFINDIKRETDFEWADLGSYKKLLTERSFLQVLFNIFLLLPFGIYLRYYFKRSFLDVVITSFLLSLFFEVTQITGLYGIYNAPYRIFDVDDLICNTLGGTIGYLITPIFTFLLPDSKSLDDNVDLETLRVGKIRRLISFVIDISLLNLIPAFRENTALRYPIIMTYFVVLPYISNGRTLGKFLTRSKLASKGKRLKLSELFLRYGSLYIGFFGLSQLLSQIAYLNQHKDYAYILIYVLLGQFILYLLVAIDFLRALIKKDRFFYEKISKTYIKVDKD